MGWWCHGKKLLLLKATVGCFTLCAQEPTKEVVRATRIAQAPRIDGLLDEECWRQGIAYNRFFESQPNPGRPDSTTTVIILYDDEAIYVGIRCFQPKDSIWMQLTRRDNVIENSDGIYVGFDTYRDGQNAFAFGVTPRNVQGDSRGYEDDTWDEQWDAVWYSNTSIHDDGWQAELAIPYAALRFPRKAIQQWGFDCYRVIRSSRRDLHSSNIDPAKGGIISQWQLLEGLEQLQPPLRLAFIPYGSAQFNRFYDPLSKAQSTQSNLRGGMDLKWGLSESFTLDATLVPDFAGVESDDIVYNLSAIEVQYDERRPFFTEGIELFDKADLFYSRRIGFVSDYALYRTDTTLVINQSPTQSRVLNSIKFSGRTAGNLGIGLLNAVTGKTYGTATAADGSTGSILVDPLSNFTVLVLDQGLPNNSFLTVTGTSVIRDQLGRNAQVLSAMTELRDRKQNWSLTAFAAASARFEKEQTNVLPAPTLGYNWKMGLNKMSGNFTFSLNHDAISPQYDINDLGYLALNNQNEWHLETSYDIYKPFGRFNEFHTEHNVYYRYRNSNQAYVNVTLRGNVFFLMRNYFGFFFYYMTQPWGNHDYEEPRMADRYYAEPASWRVGAGISSDYRKPVAVDVKSGMRFWNEKERWEWYGKLALRLRGGNRLMVLPTSEITYKNADVGWVDFDDPYPILGRRNLIDASQLLQIEYIVSPVLSALMKVRHYLLTSDYRQFYRLESNGTLTATNHQEPEDFSYNAWNIDLSISWWFLSGSEAALVWKNNIEGMHKEAIASYLQNLDNVFSDYGRSDMLLLQLRYYLDYPMVRKTIGVRSRR